MKIYHIIGSLELGGAERVLESLINYDKNKSYVLVIGKKKNNSIYIKKNINVIYFNYNILSFYNFINKISHNDPINFWHHNSFLLSFFFYLKMRRNIFWHIHSFKVDIKTFGFLNIIFFLLNILFSYFIPKKIIFCSISSLDLHKSFFYNDKTLTHIKNPINHKKIKKKKIFYDRNKSIRFLMVANFTAAKNFDQLLYLMTLIKNYSFSLDLYGRNIQGNKILIKKINKYGLNKKVNLLGFCNGNDIFSMYDFSFLISHSESLPMTIIESIVAGTPCIASNLGDISSLIKDPKFLIPKKIDKKTINNINNLYIFRNSHKYGSKINFDRELIIKNHSIEKLYSKFLKIWKNINQQY